MVSSPTRNCFTDNSRQTTCQGPGTDRQLPRARPYPLIPAASSRNCEAFFFFFFFSPGLFAVFRFFLSFFLFFSSLSFLFLLFFPSFPFLSLAPVEDSVDNLASPLLAAFPLPSTPELARQVQVSERASEWCAKKAPSNETNETPPGYPNERTNDHPPPPRQRRHNVGLDCSLCVSAIYGVP